MHLVGPRHNWTKMHGVHGIKSLSEFLPQTQTITQFTLKSSETFTAANSTPHTEAASGGIPSCSQMIWPTRSPEMSVNFTELRPARAQKHPILIRTVAKACDPTYHTHMRHANAPSHITFWVTTFLAKNWCHFQNNATKNTEQTSKNSLWRHDTQEDAPMESEGQYARCATMTKVKVTKGEWKDTLTESVHLFACLSGSDVIVKTSLHIPNAEVMLMLHYPVTYFVKCWFMS